MKSHPPPSSEDRKRTGESERTVLVSDVKSNSQLQDCNDNKNDDQVPNVGQFRSVTTGDMSNISSQVMSSSSTQTQNAIRTYLVLLHDCLAIKFVPLSQHCGCSQGNSSSSPTHHHNCSRKNRISHVDMCQSPRGFSSTNDANMMTISTRNAQISAHTQWKMKYNAVNGAADQSTLQGLFLYKEFQEMNLQCFWNAALYSTFVNLEYKGYVVPYTILVTSLPKYLTVLKTAWARKMLRSAPGYRIDFIGEIEELIADPVQKSHFVPLSDSLCWAIHEITSSGQEAFVDTILAELTEGFPAMVAPSRELVYETLEKLTRDKKVYLSPQGYFVVTPDTYRFIVSCDPSGALESSTERVRTELKLHANEAKKQGLSQEELEDGLPSCPLPQAETTTHKSLQIGQSVSNEALAKKGKSLRRSLSLRLPRSKVISITKSATVDLKVLDKLAKDMENLMGGSECPRGKNSSKQRPKRQSFLARLLRFRRSKVAATKKHKGLTRETKNPISFGTQTTSSIENIRKEVEVLEQKMLPGNEDGKEDEVKEKIDTTVQTKTEGSIVVSLAEDSDSGRYTESSSDAEIAGALAGSPIPSESPTSRILLDRFGAMSRNSTVSKDSSSLDFSCGSSLRSHNQRCHSDRMSSGSSSVSSYRDLYNRYRRKNYSTRPTSSSCGLSTPQHRSENRKPVYEPIHLRVSRKSNANPISSSFSSSPTTPVHFQQSKVNVTSKVNDGNMTVTTETNNGTFTHTVQGSSACNNNVELELLLPLSKLINDAIAAQNKTCKGSTKTSSSSSGEPKLKSEVVTMVNDLFTIKSQVSLDPNDILQTTFEVKPCRANNVQNISVKRVPSLQDCRESSII